MKQLKRILAALAAAALLALLPACSETPAIGNNGQQTANLSGAAVTLTSATEYTELPGYLCVHFEITNNTGHAVWFGNPISIQEMPTVADIQYGATCRTDFRAAFDGTAAATAQDASYMYWNDEMQAEGDWGELDFEEPLPNGMTSTFTVYVPMPAQWDTLELVYAPDYANGSAAAFTVIPSEVQHF